MDRIVLSRPAVEAGERLGFLPGDLKDKIDPYLRPLYDALHDMMPGDQVIRRMGTGEIEVAPLAFMRGRTLAHAFVILDEAQNTTPVQMKMFLTRMGEGTRMVITGDLTQIDLPPAAAAACATRWRRWKGCRASASAASTAATWCAIPWSRASSTPTTSAQRREGDARRATRATARTEAAQVDASPVLDRAPPGWRSPAEA